MSASVVACTLAQSTFTALASLSAILTIAPGFSGVRLTERDDADLFAAPSERGEVDFAIDFTEGVDTDFAIVSTPVFPLEPGIVKEPNRSRKRQVIPTCVDDHA
jgi:hypothetical protein